MIIYKTIEGLQQWISKQNKASASIGFVPTMGALHKGHLSLIALSKEHNQVIICSIFVNPTQFNDPRDFEKYPITIEQDILLLEQAGCTVLFLPNVQEMYPNGTKLSQHYNLGFLESVLEGSFRNGHFQGVCQVVNRLLDIVQPHTLFLGQKDYQQCMVIKKMIEITNKNMALVIGQTLREESGLAMSSRNMRLSKQDKNTATAIYQSLNLIKNHLAIGNLQNLQQQAEETLLKASFSKIDYVAICNANTLQVVNTWDGKEKLVALVAAFLNGVRLIDNMVLN